MFYVWNILNIYKTFYFYLSKIIQIFNGTWLKHYQVENVLKKTSINLE